MHCRQRTTLVLPPAPWQPPWAGLMWHLPAVAHRVGGSRAAGLAVPVPTDAHECWAGGHGAGSKDAQPAGGRRQEAASAHLLPCQGALCGRRGHALKRTEACPSAGWGQHRPLQTCWSGLLSSASRDSFQRQRHCSAASQPKRTRASTALGAALGLPWPPRRAEMAELGIRASMQ